MVRSFFIVMSIMIAASCAVSSGVVPTGGDTFMISRSKKGFDVTGSMVKAGAVNEAYDFCSNSNKDLKVVTSTSKDMVPFKSDAQAEIEFTCVDKLLDN